MLTNRLLLRKMILYEMKSLSKSSSKLPDFLYAPLEEAILKSQFWTYSNVEEESEINSTPGGWQTQTDAAISLQSAIQDFLDINSVKIGITVISAEAEDNKKIKLPVTKNHRLYPNKLVVGGQQSVNSRGRFIMYLFMVPVDEDFNAGDVNPSTISRAVGNIIRHEIIHAIQLEKRRKNQRISRSAAKDEFEKSGEIVDSDDRVGYLSSKIEIDAYAHEFAEELLQKYGKEKSLNILRGLEPLEPLDLSDQFKEYLDNTPGQESVNRLKNKIYSHIIDLTSREIYTDDLNESKINMGIIGELVDSYTYAKKSSDLYYDDSVKRDAFRHIYASAIFAQSVGESATRILGQFNELAGALKSFVKGKGFDSEWIKDSDNNEIGIRIGLSTSTRSEAKNRVFQVIESGEFYVDDSKTMYNDINEAKKKKKRKKKNKFKSGGSYPDETYEIGTEKNLYLDRPTSHGGWPEGPSKSFTSNKPVAKQISDWLKHMNMMD